jgi:3-dehydroquinate synthase
MEEYYEIRDMFVPFGLPISEEGLDAEKILALMRSDKKAAEGKIRFILLHGIGDAFIEPSVSDEQILAAINEINYVETGD